MADKESSEDLTPTQTAGYKISAKRTVDELAQLDSQDESLRKWKESLGLQNAAAVAAPTDDPRRVVVLSLALEVAGRPDYVVDLSNTDAVASLSSQKMIIKENTEYRLKVKFRVQHEVVSGLKYIHVVKFGAVKVDKMEEMLGSYSPSAEIYEKKFLTEESPSGMLARRSYNVKSKFIDDDGTTHLEWNWSLEIKKDWA